MTEKGFGRPTYQIDIREDDGSKTPVRQDILRLIESVEVEQVWDGADQCTLTCRAWDEYNADFRLVGERILDPGTDIIVRATYGDDKPHLIGKFKIAKHTPSFPEGGVPMVTIVAYDGFANLMDNTFPGDYGGAADGVQTYTDVARIVARKYGWGLAADVAPRIKFKTKKKRVRVRQKGKTVRDAKGKAVRKTKTVKSKIVKNAGDTDAKMVKDLAQYSGFLLPKVRYVEHDPMLKRLHEVTENTYNRDVLFFRRANIRRQKAESDTFDFVYRRKDGRPATLRQFDPEWNTDEVPIAVRVTGVVRTTVGKKRRRVRKRIHIVEAQLTDAEQLRVRSTLLRRAQRETNPRKAQELRDKAAQIQPTIAVTRETKTRLRKKDKKRFKNVGTAMIDVLDKEKRPVKEYDRVERRKVQTMRREVIGRTLVVTDGSELRDIAKGWLAARLQLHITASAVVANIRKAETLYPNQVHTFSGLPAEYEGTYMIRKCTHVWSASGHVVNMSLQRVAELPSQISSRESTDE